MRRMVGCHDIDGAIGQCLSNRVNILLRPKRRIHLENGISTQQLDVGENEVMGSDFCRHGHATLFGPTNHIHTCGGGHMTNVKTRAGIGGQQYIARNDDGLRNGWPTGQSQLPSNLTFIGLCTNGERCFLCMLGDDAIELSHLTQCLPHHICLVDTMPIVAKQDWRCGGGMHRGHGGEVGSA